nr:hypothetical protein [Bacteroidota bacterium]
MIQSENKQHYNQNTKLEALIEDALEGRLDAEALERLHRALEHHPELKGDWETLNRWNPFQEVEQLEPESSYQEPAFEQNLKRAWTEKTAGQNLYQITYTYFMRYALAASFTILAALSLLNLQTDIPGIPVLPGISDNSGSSDISDNPGNPGISWDNISEASTSESFLAEVQDYLYGSDENHSTAYYLTLFEAEPGQETATETDRPVDTSPVNQTQLQ